MLVLVEVGQIVIDNPGSNYSVGDPLFFDNTNTEGAGASAIVSCVGGAIAPELGDTALHTITGTTQASSTSITSITTSTLYAAKQFVLQGDTTNASAIVTNIHTLNLVVGASISGAGIPTNTTISSINISATGGAGANIQVGEVGLGPLTDIFIGNGGSGYAIGDVVNFTFDTGGSASAKVSVVNGGIAPETGDISTYGMETFDHIILEGTEATDAYTGNQIEMETATFADLSVTGEAGEVVNVTVFNPGSGYELMPTITPATSKLTFNSGALTTSGEFSTGETISNDASPAVTATIVTSIRGSFTISKATGAFAAGQVITGNQ